MDRRAEIEGSCMAMIRPLRYQWTLLSPCSRISLSILLLLLATHVFIGAMDIFFHSYDQKNAKVNNFLKNNSYAVVINTYKRPERLRDAVQHYAQTCGPKFGVKQVFIVWAERGVAPPSSFFPEETQLRNGKSVERSTVQVLQVAKNSLNSRFEPIASLASEAIFMVDDDVRVDCSSLYRGFQAWSSAPEAMAGYYPRLAATSMRSSNNGELIYYSWPTVFIRQQFNFILSKASFLHRKYLSLYSDASKHPQEILDYVDEHMNCEDVALAMLVANATKDTAQFPIYVEGSVTDKGLFGGISTGSGHMATRSKCLTDLTSIYENHGWGSPLAESISLEEYSWVHHSPGFWWQSRPSNFFEWFALGNVLK